MLTPPCDADNPAHFQTDKLLPFLQTFLFWDTIFTEFLLIYKAMWLEYQNNHSSSRFEEVKREIVMVKVSRVLKLWNLGNIEILQHTNTAFRIIHKTIWSKGIIWKRPPQIHLLWLKWGPFFAVCVKKNIFVMMNHLKIV